MKLLTLGPDSVFSCLEVTCEDCSLRLRLNGKSDFGTGESLEVEAVVETHLGAEACETTAQVVFEGFGCAPNTLQIFLLALSIVVSVTVPWCSGAGR